MKTLLFLTLLVASLASADPTKKNLIDVLRNNPSDSWALYNLGLMNYLDEDFGEAIKHWKALKSLEPEDWKVREKLIQAYWGAEQEKAANTEIAELRKARKSGKHSDLTEKGFFICDQFQVGKVRAFVLEYYELKGDRPLAWKFILKSGEDRLDYHLSIGSYPSATEFARAEGSIGPKERRYHLDGYWKNGSHTTYNFYRNRPNYQKVRKEVRRIIKGDQKPVSSMTPKSQKGGKKKLMNPLRLRSRRVARNRNQNRRGTLSSGQIFNVQKVMELETAIIYGPPQLHLLGTETQKLGTRVKN